MRELLEEKGWIKTPQARLTPLTGGVSSDIYLVEEGDQRFVVKRALAKLKVAADWFADIGRNHTEQAYIRYVGAFREDAMPKILDSDAEAGLFAMEYLDGFENWKATMMAGQCDPRLAQQAGALLGDIHRHSWGDADTAKIFDTMEDFQQLRIEPYLLAAAEKHPAIVHELHQEAERLKSSRQCLVHGDYSPKNILFKGNRLVPLDCEVACFADAAFDMAFLLTHLYLKALYLAPQGVSMQTMIQAAVEGYRSTNPDHAPKIEVNCARLLPMLMLARVDGKSPVEYLDEDSRQCVREFALDAIRAAGTRLVTLQDQWFKTINNG